MQPYTHSHMCVRLHAQIHALSHEPCTIYSPCTGRKCPQQQQKIASERERDIRTHKQQPPNTKAHLLLLCAVLFAVAVVAVQPHVCVCVCSECVRGMLIGARAYVCILFLYAHMRIYLYIYSIVYACKCYCANTFVRLGDCITRA